MSGCVVYLYDLNRIGDRSKIAEFDEYEDALACLGGDEAVTEDGIYAIEKNNAK